MLVGAGGGLTINAPVGDFGAASRGAAFQGHIRKVDNPPVEGLKEEALDLFQSLRYPKYILLISPSGLTKSPNLLFANMVFQSMHSRNWGRV